MQEDFLFKKLQERKANNAWRSLKLPVEGMVDLCSNDYLGIAKRNMNARHTSEIQHTFSSGSTGSRLLSGNYALIEEAEKYIADFHLAEAALIFNSGYDANLGLLSSVPQKGDTILYDQLSHASIRDGIRLSFANAFSFRHNDLNDLENKLMNAKGNLFVVTESVFSMDGDLAPLNEIAAVCERYSAHLIADEAHATGIIGERGEGLVQHLSLQDRCFARIHTFGKALGAHGAAVLGTRQLADYLINFSRPFIYTTALPEVSVEHIRQSYQLFPALQQERLQLAALASIFQNAEIRFEKLKSTTPIQGVIVPGNEQARNLAAILQQNNLDVRAILYPTVPKGSERLRIVLHSFNSVDELNELVSLLG